MAEPHLRGKYSVLHSMPKTLGVSENIGNIVPSPPFTLHAYRGKELLVQIIAWQTSCCDQLRAELPPGDLRAGFKEFKHWFPDLKSAYNGSACLRFFHRHRRPWIPRTMNLASCNLTCHRKREHQNFTKKSVAGRLPTYFFHYMRKNTLGQISLLPGALYPVAPSHPLGATIEMREPRGARSRAGGTSPAGGVDKGVKKMFRNILRAHESV